MITPMRDRESPSDISTGKLREVCISCPTSEPDTGGCEDPLILTQVLLDAQRDAFLHAALSARAIIRPHLTELSTWEAVA